MSKEPTFLFELRDQAQMEPRPFIRLFMRDHADFIEEAIKAFAESPTRSRLATLNSQWARGWYYLQMSQERPEPEPPLAGSPDVFEEDEETA